MLAHDELSAYTVALIYFNQGVLTGDWNGPRVSVIGAYDAEERCALSRRTVQARRPGQCACWSGEPPGGWTDQAGGRSVPASSSRSASAAVAWTTPGAWWTGA